MVEDRTNIVIISKKIYNFFGRGLGGSIVDDLPLKISLAYFTFLLDYAADRQNDDFDSYFRSNNGKIKIRPSDMYPIALKLKSLTAQERKQTIQEAFKIYTKLWSKAPIIKDYTPSMPHFLDMQ
jgi:hypothetical protein